MIAKIIQNGNVKKCLDYVLDKKDAELLYTHDVRDYNRKAMLQDFNFYQGLNSRVKNSVIHLSISFHNNDAGLVSSEMMKKISGEVLAGMGWNELPHVCCRHNDQKHPHFHLVVGRVGRNGKAADDSYSWLRMRKVLTALEKQYPELTAAVAKDLAQINLQKLRGGDAIKMKIYRAIKKELYNSRNIDHLFSLIKNRHGVETQLVYRGKTEHVQGIKFGIGDVWFKGSQIDKSCSITKLKQVIEQTKLSDGKTLPSVKADQPSLSDNPNAHNKKTGTGVINKGYQGEDIFDELARTVYRPKL